MGFLLQFALAESIETFLDYVEKYSYIPARNITRNHDWEVAESSVDELSGRYAVIHIPGMDLAI